MLKDGRVHVAACHHAPTLSGPLVEFLLESAFTFTHGVDDLVLIHQRSLDSERLSHVQAAAVKPGAYPDTDDKQRGYTEAAMGRRCAP